MPVIDVPVIKTKSKPNGEEKSIDSRLERYTLPKEITAGIAKFENDILSYGVIEWKNSTYCTVASGKMISGTTGIEETTYRFSKVANFTVQVLQHMEDEKLPMKLVKITNTYGRSRIFETQSNNFGSINKFKDAVEGKGNYHFTGNVVQFDKLKAKLFDKMGDGRMITVMGWQPEGFFCLNNAAIDDVGRVIMLDKYGSFKLNGTDYYVPSANHIYAQNHTKFQPQKRATLLEGASFSDWSTQMTVVHREHAMMAICFGISCAFSDHIFKLHGFFPMVYLYGEPSTGKGNLIQAIQSLFGRAQQPITIMGKANTDKAKIRKFAQFTNMLVFMEEFRNAVSTEVIEMLKGLWNRYGYERGNLDSAVSTDNVPINSGVMATGNDYITDDALLTRFIIDEMVKDGFTSEEKKAYDKLSLMIENGYSSILVELLTHRLAFEKEYRGYYQAARNDIHEILSSANGVVERMEQNLAVLLAVFQFFSDRGLVFGFTKPELLSYMQICMKRQALKRDNQGETSRFWDCVLAAKKQGQITHEVDYKIDGNTLYIHQTSVYNAYAITHYTLFRAAACGKSTIMDKLKKTTAYQGFKAVLRYGPNSRSSAMQFDLRKLDQNVKDMLVPPLPGED